jgi:hypothetical protein
MNNARLEMLMFGISLRVSHVGAWVGVLEDD